MNLKNTILLAIVLFGSLSAFAGYSEKYPGKNLALICGDIDIVTDNYTGNIRGKLANEDMELGSVWAIKGNGTIQMVKTKGPKRTLLGEKKGFGYYDGGSFFKLDLRNTLETNSLNLEVTQTGEKIDCEVYR